MGDVEEIPTPDDMGLAEELALLGEIAAAQIRQQIAAQFDDLSQQRLHGLLCMLITTTEVMTADLQGLGHERINASACATAILHQMLRDINIGLCSTFPEKHSHGTWPLVTLRSDPRDLFPGGGING